MPIEYIFDRMAHHSAHSGYDQLIQHIDCQVRGPNSLYRLFGYCPERILAQLRRTAGTWYNSHALRLELQNMPAFFFKKNQIFHFLYGEDNFHYSAYLNPRRSNKFVATYHFPPEKFYQTTIATRHLKSLDAIIIIAPNQETIFKNIAPPERVHLIPHGVDTACFTPGDAAAKHPGNCLFVGTHLRDFATLREVILEINRADPHISFTIVTSKEFFPLFEQLSNVSLFSSVTEQKLLQLYQTATLLLLPLLDSTANNAILEAMACGLPVITNAAGGIGMYLPQEAGMLLPRGEASLMAQKTIELIYDPERLAAMAHAARSTAESFDWAVIAKKMQGLYRHIIE